MLIMQFYRNDLSQPNENKNNVIEVKCMLTKYPLIAYNPFSMMN